MNQIIQNEAECKKCNDIIWSAYTHDFKSCSCGAIAVDGGMSYIKRSGNPEDIEDRSLSADKDQLINCTERVEKLLNIDFAEDIDIAIEVAMNYGIKNHETHWLDWNSEKCVEAVKWGKDTGRNSFGIVLAVIRALRDTGGLNMEKFNND